METERITPVLSERIEPIRRLLIPSAFLAGKDRLARLSLWVTLLALIGNALALGVALSNVRQQVLFVVLDPNGNVVVAPGARFIEAKELHVQQGLLAANALLLRNPKDFDQPEILQAILSPGALEQATALKASDASEFNDRQIQQKPQISRIDAIETRPEEVQVQITGQLARWGAIQKVPFTEVVPFTLRLVLKPNPDLLRNRRQPTLVTQFTLRYEKPAP